MDDLISRSWLLSEYDKRHKGPPGGARKLIEEAPSALGTDCISRQAAVDVIDKEQNEIDVSDVSAMYAYSKCKAIIKQLPPAQPEIIYCKDCVKHNKGLGNYEVHPDGSTTWIWKDSACPLVSWRDKAQGHEFDYQFCAYAERRENG